MSNIIYPQGGLEVKITIPAGDRVAVYTRDVAEVFQVDQFPNSPAKKRLLQRVVNDQWVSAAFTDGGEIVILPEASPALYEIGLTPRVTERKSIRTQPGATALNATGALTAAIILDGIVSSTTAAAVVATLDTGAVMGNSTDMAIGESFDWSAINTGVDDFTVTAAASGHNVVGAGLVDAGTSGLFRTRRTGAATFTTYRVG